jgi:hypothetical protein
LQLIREDQDIKNRSIFKLQQAAERNGEGDRKPKNQIGMKEVEERLIKGDRKHTFKQHRR